MSEDKRRGFFQRAFLAAWAMATLVLVFCVGLMARDMIRQGRSPFDLSEVPEFSEPSVREQVAAESEGRDVLVYFASPDSRYLVGEPRRIEGSEFTVRNCRAVLEVMAKGPQGSLNPILPATPKVRAMYLLRDGELVIDLAREFVQTQQRSTSAEALTMFGIVASLTQPGVKGEQEPAVRAVRFLVEGAPPSETYESHLDLSEPLTPDPQWIVAEEAAAAGNV